MRAGFVISIAAHVALAGMFVVVVPEAQDLSLSETPHMVVELIDIAEETIVTLQPAESVVDPEPQAAPKARPVARPEPAFEAPQPEPVPEPAPEPAPEPEPEPAPEPEPEPVSEPQPEPVTALPEPAPEPSEAQVVEKQPVPVPAPSPKIQIEPKPEPEPEKAPVFDLANLSALLDKRLENRVDSNVVSRDADAGNTAEGSITVDRDIDQPQNLRMTMSEVDAVRQQYYRCWKTPLGAPSDRDLSVQIRVEISPEGALRSRTLLTDRARVRTDPFLKAMVASVERAVERCSPLQNLPKAKYEKWRTIEMNFDPADLLG